jgi:hypothetical protein
MGMRVPIIDDLAWLLFRLIGAIQAMIFQFVGSITKTENIREKADLIGRVYAGWYIFGAKDPNSVPKIVKDRGLLVGRVMLAIIVLSIIQSIAKAVIK